MKVRFLAFREPTDVPGKNGAERIQEYDPKYPQTRGFDITVDWQKRAFRIACNPDWTKGHPEEGRWVSREDGRPLYGTGAVRYAPFESVKYWELSEDAAPPAPPKAESKK